MSLITLSTWSIFGWMSQGGHSKPLLLLALFYYFFWVVNVILVSAQVLLVMTLDFSLTIVFCVCHFVHFDICTCRLQSIKLCM